MSWIPHFSDGHKAKYLQIVDAIADDVRNGNLKVGDRLPSQRKIAQTLGIDLTTVTRALNEARRVGLVEARTGAGTIISANDRDARPYTTAIPVLDMSMNIPPQPSQIQLPKLISKTIERILSKKAGGMSLSYQDSQGSMADRQAAAFWLQSRLGELDIERLVVSGGAQNALAGIFDVLLQSGDSICAANLTYPGLKALALHKSVTVLPVDTDADGLIPASLEKLCRTSPPKALYVVPTIDNPTTATIPVARREELVKIAYRYGLQIIEDDPYSALVENPLPAFAKLAPDITWHIATLSKCLTPAFRIAYAVSPSSMQAIALTGVLRATALTASPLMASVATRWITDGTADKVVAATRQENRERQAIAAVALAGLPYVYNSDSHHLWLTLPFSWKAADFAMHASRSGLSVVPSYAFATSSIAPEAVRISLGAAEDKETLEHSLRLLVSLIQHSPLTTKAIV